MARIILLTGMVIALMLSTGCFLADDGQFYSDAECSKLEYSRAVGSDFFAWVAGCPD